MYRASCIQRPVESTVHRDSCIQKPHSLTVELSAAQRASDNSTAAVNCSLTFTAQKMEATRKVNAQ
jgi:hypothetical protein